MDMMLLRITTFFHAQQPSVYSILFSPFFNLTKLIEVCDTNVQEDNDQAFPIAL